MRNFPLETKLTVDQLASEYPNTFVLLRAENPSQTYAFNTASFNPRSHTQYVWLVELRRDTWYLVGRHTQLEWGNKCPVDIMGFTKTLFDDLPELKRDASIRPPDYEPQVVPKSNRKVYFYALLTARVAIECAADDNADDDQIIATINETYHFDTDSLIGGQITEVDNVKLTTIPRNKG